MYTTIHSSVWCLFCILNVLRSSPLLRLSLRACRFPYVANFTIVTGRLAPYGHISGSPESLSQFVMPGFIRQSRQSAIGLHAREEKIGEVIGR